MYKVVATDALKEADAHDELKLLDAKLAVLCVIFDWVNWVTIEKEAVSANIACPDWSDHDAENDAIEYNDLLAQDADVAANERDDQEALVAINDADDQLADVALNDLDAHDAENDAEEYKDDSDWLAHEDDIAVADALAYEEVVDHNDLDAHEALIEFIEFLDQLEVIILNSLETLAL